jgi:thymidylate synthase (FAD)
MKVVGDCSRLNRLAMSGRLVTSTSTCRTWASSAARLPRSVCVDVHGAQTLVENCSRVAPLPATASAESSETVITVSVDETARARPVEARHASPAAVATATSPNSTATVSIGFIMLARLFAGSAPYSTVTPGYAEWRRRDGRALRYREAVPEDIEFRSDITVELVRSSAHDSDVLFAARVSTQGEQTLETAQASESAQSSAAEAEDTRARGLINYLMRDRHGSPFEHNSMTFYVQAPIFVFREFMRHRIASYNEESGRYRELNPVFYVPNADRNLVQVGKPGAYEFLPGSDEQISLVDHETRAQSVSAFHSYQRMLDAGIAREVARIVLPLNIYSSMYVTLNARSLMNFLSLRTKREGTTFPSFPQREIEKMEDFFAELMPLTHAAFNGNGRVAP